MSQKGNKGKGGTEVVKEEDLLTAVLVADSFCKRFRPLDEDRPKALLPLVNQPMIEYSLESLLLSGVQKTYVYCVSHADQIRQYLKSSKWVKPFSPMSVEVLSQSSNDCRSLGDALRDMEGKGLIRGDFIILSADVVSNVQLKPILEKHRERRKADKGLIMTHVFKKLFPGHRSRAPDEELILAVNSATGRILHYQLTGHIKKLTFPLKIFKESGPIQLRYDLTDTHISICSNAVLPLFADNFDYQTWSDFVKGILINEEILGNTIYCHELEGSYATQVSNIPMYDAVSKDIIQRWTSPLVPDLSTGNGSVRHSLSRHMVYKQPQVTLSRGCVLESDVVIGERTFVGEKTFVTHSVIGKNCSVGKEVLISNAYIWDNVVIKDKCRIDLAIIANGVVIEEGVELGRGCIIGPGVKLSSGTKVPPNSRLVANPPQTSDGFESSDEEEITLPPLSAGSLAYIYVEKKDDDSDEESLVNDIWDLNIDEESEDEDSDDEMLADIDAEDDIDVDDLPDLSVKTFYKEVLDSLKRGFVDKIKGENLVLEINSSKFAYNVTISELNSLVTKAILHLPNIISKEPIVGAVQYLTILQPILERLLPVLKNYLKSEESQLHCLKAFDDFGIINKHFAQTISKVLHYLYVKDVLEESTILKWHADPPEDPTANDSVRKYARVFVEWLEEAESESEESDSS